MKRYPKYKPSGIEWIGEIPEHWREFRNFGLFEERSDKGHEDEELLSVTIDRGIIKQDEITERKDSSNEDKTNYKLVEKGDLAYNKMRMWQGAVGYSDYRGIVSPAYIILKPRIPIEPKFYHYLFRLPNYNRESYRYGHGICDDQHSLRFWQFKKNVSPIPPLPEQTAIAAFLDEKTAKIGEAIEKKQRLIELLDEYKTAEINRAVTKGLNPKTKMKDTGIEWIGEIPEEWEVKRLASVGKFSKGCGISRSDLTEEGFPVILYGDIYTKYEIKVKDIVNSIPEEILCDTKTVNRGALLLTGSGETAEDIGKCVMIDVDETSVGGDVIIFEQIENDSLFLSYVLNSKGAVYQKAAMAKGEIIVHIYSSQLKDLRIPIPPSIIQAAIAEYLDRKAEQVEKAKQDIRQEIKTLKEYRTALISEAVTGKIDIRDEA